MKIILLLAVFFLAPVALAQKAVSLREYDKFDDFTRISLARSITVFDRFGHELSLDVVAGHPGYQTRRPLALALHFIHYGPKWLFLKDGSLEVIGLLDGERVRYGNAKRVGSEITRYGVREVLTMALPPADFARLISSARVELRVGILDFELKDKQLAILNRYADEAGLSQVASPAPPAAPDPRNIPTAPKPTPTPAKRICSQGGYRVPCPEEQ